MLDKNEEEPPEREEIQRLIEDLHTRKFSYSEIAVLTQKNEDAVRVSGWLNEKQIPFISYSNLDIRRRKITGEVISLLNFLDSPIDDHAFASFILGGIFLHALNSDGPEPYQATSQNTFQSRLRQLIFTVSGKEPLYKAFQQNFPELWERYFSGLFRVAGYFPLYDLAVEAFSTFRLLDTCRDEQAAPCFLDQAPGPVRSRGPPGPRRPTRKPERAPARLRGAARTARGRGARRGGSCR